MLTLGNEVWTDVGGIYIGYIVGCYHKRDASFWIVCETKEGNIFVRQRHEIRNIRELYELAG